MWIGFISLFPEFIELALGLGVLGRAAKNKIIDPHIFNPRDYTSDKHQTADDRPYGGGPGMVMMAEPLLKAVEAAKRKSINDVGDTAHVVYLSPQGERLDQRSVEALAKCDSLLLIAGRYEGIDQRVIDSVVDQEVSIGDYVLSGGEIPSMVLTDAIARLIPGTLGNRESTLVESHLDGLLDYPQYTRPEVIEGEKVPEVLLSGDHSAIDRWRRGQALWNTWKKRPDLLTAQHWTRSNMELLEEIFPLDKENENAKE